MSRIMKDMMLCHEEDMYGKEGWVGGRCRNARYFVIRSPDIRVKTCSHLTYAGVVSVSGGCAEVPG